MMMTRPPKPACVQISTLLGECLQGTSPNWNANVRNNKIKGFPGNGIVAEEQSGGTLIYSWIVGNEVRDNGSGGILIDVNNYNIELFDNKAEGNHVDCEDDTTSGGPTPTIVDEWLNNAGNLSSPTGLCTPGRWHDH
jgi:hypothetical protein